MAALQNDKAAIDAAVECQVRYTKDVHTLKLVRWYGRFRTGGDYNKDTFFTVLDRLEENRATRDQ